MDSSTMCVDCWMIVSVTSTVEFALKLIICKNNATITDSINALKSIILVQIDQLVDFSLLLKPYSERLRVDRQERGGGRVHEV